MGDNMPGKPTRQDLEMALSREKIDAINFTMVLVKRELIRAMLAFDPFASAHEGYAVILEEMDELWDEVKGNKDPEAYNRMLKEARQVAAMAARFMVEITPLNQGKEATGDG